MKLSFHCRTLPPGLKFYFFVLLLHPVSTQRNINQIYFLDIKDNIELKGLDSPGNGQFVWEWKPHSGQHTHLLGQFHRGNSGRWNSRWNNKWRSSDFQQELSLDNRNVGLIIKIPKFKFAGLFTLTQTQPTNQILRQYELFGIKVKVSPQRPVEGSDVTLSCTISRLPDTVSLHWKPVSSSQQNRRNTDQIRLNNTVYLMVRHVTVEDERLYQCEVRENGNVVLTSKADFTVDMYLYQEHYTLYRPSTDYSEFHLVCYSRYVKYFTAVWNWKSHQRQDHQKQIASVKYSEPINVSRTDLGNRLVALVEQFNGKNFSVRIAPVLFGDAGVYTCSLELTAFLTIELITVKVTAEPSDTVTEGDTVTLSCSVSDVTASTRLVWINGDGETVGEKTLKGEEGSPSLIIQKAERGRGKWTCGVFDQDRLLIIIPYYQELSGIGNSIYFFHQEGNFVLKGPDNPGSDSIDLEWSPHSGQQTTKRLATFHREGQRWTVQWSDEFSQIPDISQRLHVDWGTLNLKIRKPTFEFAGLFTWNQTQTTGKILRQWEVFGIKVEADSQRPVIGSDVTLSCTISRLPDTVSLHWKPRGSSQRNNNTDQIHLNNTVYLMVRHIGTRDPSLYTWEVQENGSIVLTGDTNVAVDEDLHNKTYTIYRAGIDHSELTLICESYSELHKTKWIWKSHLFQNRVMEVATSYKSQLIYISGRSYFKNRLRTTEENLNVSNFNVRIVPVQFEDAGVYTCSQGSHQYVAIELITVRVTAEPPNAVTEGDSVSLTCSVSEVSESMRLVWINSAGETVDEKIFMEQKNEGESLQLIIPTDDKVQRKWMCALFHQDRPKIFILHHLQVNKDRSFKHTTVVITGGLALLLIIILVMVLCLRKYKDTGLGNQSQKSQQPKRNIEDDSNLYANPNEMHPIQGTNAMPEPETSHIAEYMSVSRKAVQKDTEENIHYGSICFKENAPGERHATLSSNQVSDTNLPSSNDNISSVVYAQITKNRNE
ncbi:uncharacterized protein LOC132405565 [Hypanus sabinus]|uniref:uncharacterized protein LOC132405565 n=1 Tax=Hypanus sabinus TaxID=79690 RepID=UPI0028C3D9F8|nr:uncharacterized protein LOC132405565 [Hypanus sabinus]